MRIHNNQGDAPLIYTANPKQLQKTVNFYRNSRVRIAGSKFTKPSDLPEMQSNSKVEPYVKRTGSNKKPLELSQKITTTIPEDVKNNPEKMKVLKDTMKKFNEDLSELSRYLFLVDNNNNDAPAKKNIDDNFKREGNYINKILSENLLSLVCKNLQEGECGNIDKKYLEELVKVFFSAAIEHHLKSDYFDFTDSRTPIGKACDVKTHISSKNDEVYIQTSKIFKKILSNIKNKFSIDIPEWRVI